MPNTYYENIDEPTPLTRTRAGNEAADRGRIELAFDKLPTEDELKSGAVNYAADTGVANAYVVTTPYTTAYFEGLNILFSAGNSNTGASTINVNGLGAKSLVQPDGAALEANDIVAGGTLSIVYDGSVFKTVIGSTSAARAAADAAAVSAAEALVSEIAAAASAAAALVSEGNAATSETNAGTSETNAANSAAAALVSEGNASTSETNASNSAAAALVSEGNAATSETNASNSAAAALVSEGNAATSETNASNSAAAALVSELAAAASAGSLTYASNAEALALTVLDRIISPGRLGEVLGDIQQDVVINGLLEVNADNFTITDISPKITIIESDANVDEGRWDTFVNGNQLAFRAVNDAANVADTWLVVTRLGVTVSDVIFTAQTTFNEDVTLDTSALTLTGNSSSYLLTQHNNQAPANQRRFTYNVADNGFWSLQARDDAGTFLRNIISADHTNSKVLFAGAVTMPQDLSFDNGISIKNAGVAVITGSGTVDVIFAGDISLPASGAIEFGAGYIGNSDSNWGLLYKPEVAGALAAHGFTNAAGGVTVRFTDSGGIFNEGVMSFQGGFIGQPTGLGRTNVFFTDPTAGTVLSSVQGTSTNCFTFTEGVGGATILSIASNGSLTVPLALNVGGNVVPASGQGIDFSATANGAGTTTSEVFKDYEEGTFVPIVSDGTNNASFSTQFGHYTKTGNRVTISIRVRLTSKGSMSGALQVKGMPFLSEATAFSESVITCMIASGALLTAGVSVVGTIANSKTVIQLKKWSTSGGVDNLNASDIAAGLDLSLTGSYETPS